MARPADWPSAAQIRALADGRGRLCIRVTPNAGRVAIALPESDDKSAAGPVSAGQASAPQGPLRVRITQTPEDGKANAAVITLLAKALGVPKSALSLDQGVTSRTKIIRLLPLD